MTVTVKLMSGENLADEDCRKSFKLFTDIHGVDFGRDTDGAPYVVLWRGEGTDPETYYLEGNAYVMNPAGKTISSFGHASPKHDIEALDLQAKAP